MPARSLVLLAVLASPVTLSAQGANPSIEIFPNPAPPGAALMVRITGARDVPVFYTVTSSGAPCDVLQYDGINGSFVFCGGAFPLCGTTPATLAPCQVVQRTITACSTPGDYAVRWRYTDGTGVLRAEWACYRVQGPNQATLTATGGPQIGQPLNLTLASPSDPGAIYIVAPAFTSNTGQTFGTLAAHLDPDALFQLYLSGLAPALFSNFIGVLDATGAGPAISLNVPAFGPLQCLPLKLQAVVQTLGGTLRRSNQLNFNIQ